MADLVSTVPAHECDLCASNLPVRAVDTLQLPCAFDDLQHALDVRLRESTT